MQERHLDRRKYFKELAMTSRKYYLPYLSQFYPEKIVRDTDAPYGYLCRDFSVLEIGCGEGGNLYPFAVSGADVLGVDMAAGKIENARNFFREGIAQECNVPVTGSFDFIASDIFAISGFGRKFDLILVHDVIEHIHDKTAFLSNCKAFMKDGAFMFVAFPPWQMPFGGHHQMASGKLVSHLPYIHLMHKPFYKGLLKLSGESRKVIDDLMEIKDTGISSGRCMSLVRKSGYVIQDCRLFFINPHYEEKFGLRPRRLWQPLSAIPYLRDLFTTSCWLMIRL